MTGVAEPPKANDAKSYHDRYFGITEEDFSKSLSVNTYVLSSLALRTRLMKVAHFDRIGPYFLSSAFIPLLFASKVRAKYNNDNIQPQIINTSSMNGWTKVSSLSTFRNAHLVGQFNPFLDSLFLSSIGSSNRRTLLPLPTLESSYSSHDFSPRTRFPPSRHSSESDRPRLVRHWDVSSWNSR